LRPVRNKNEFLYLPYLRLLQGPTTKWVISIQRKLPNECNWFTLLNLFQIDVVTQVEQTDNDDRTRTDQLECQNCVKLRVDTTPQAVRDQLVQTDSDVERVPVIKHKKLRSNRITDIRQRLLRDHLGDTEDMMESKVHVRSEETIHEKRDIVRSQPFSKEDVMNAWFCCPIFDTPTRT